MSRGSIPLGAAKQHVNTLFEEIDMKLAELLLEFVEKRGDEWVVLNHAKTNVLGTHPTKKKAMRQLRAIEANKHKQ